MSGKSKNYEIPARYLAAARPIAARYQVLLWQEDGEFYGRGVELPTVFADGPTPDACVKSLREAMTGVVAAYLEQGETPPAPATTGKRDQQINLRVTAEEKVLLEAKATQYGAGVSEYIRAVALEK